MAADYFFTAPHKRMFTELIFNAFPVDRTGTGANRGLSKQLLKAGVPLLIFPEGTRSRTGKMGSFKIGAAGLAKRGWPPALASFTMLVVGLVTDIEVLSRVLVIAGAFTLVFNLVQLVRRSSGPGKNGDQA